MTSTMFAVGARQTLANVALTDSSLSAAVDHASVVEQAPTNLIHEGRARAHRGNSNLLGTASAPLSDFKVRPGP